MLSVLAATFAELARILVVRVGRTFLIRFIHAPLYVATIAIADRYLTLKTQVSDRVKTRTKDRTHSTLEKIDRREPRVSDAIVEEVVICAASRHGILRVYTVVLL